MTGRITRSQTITAIDAKIASESTHIFQDLSQPIKERSATIDDLVPEERTLCLIKEIKPKDIPTRLCVRFYRSVHRMSKKKAGNKKAGNLHKGPHPETFSIGDTVEFRTHTGEVGVAIIIALYELDLAEDAHEGLPFQWGKFKARLHRFQVAGKARVNMHVQKRPYIPGEVYYYHCVDSVPTDLSSILHKCVVKRKVEKGSAVALSRASPTKWTTSNHSPSKSRSLVPQGAPSPLSDGANGAEDAVHIYYTNRSCHLASNFFYEINWPDFYADKSGVQGDCEGSQWQLDPEKDVKGHKIVRTRNNDVDETSSTGSDDSEGEYNEIREQKSQDMEGSEESDEDDTRMGALMDESSGEGEGDSDESSTMEIRSLKTPSKKRKRNVNDHGNHFKTPSKRRRRLGGVEPTPHSKAALRKRRNLKLKVRPPTTTAQDNTALQSLPADPYIRATHTLHVGERPDALSCRDEEYVAILEAVLELLQETSGGCIYISGVPGTGKTATVHTIIRELKIMAENSECNPFTFTEINGLRVPEPNAAYPLLWEALSGHDPSTEGHMRIGPKEALRRLTTHFNLGVSQNNGAACIVLMDELDQLLTTKQDVVYNFFNWPNLVGSKLIVLAVANTHDLPERTLSAKVRSRLGMVRINFKPYTQEQLVEIVQSRLQRAASSLPSELSTVKVLQQDAVKYASARISRVTGDARRVLDICRRTVEKTRHLKREAKIKDVEEVVIEAQNTPTARFVEGLGWHEKVMLAACLKCVRCKGVEEIAWIDLVDRHLGLIYQIADDDSPQRKPKEQELLDVLDSLVSSSLLSVESGALAARKAAGDRKVVLLVEKDEVRRVLADVGPRWDAILGVQG